MFNFGLYTQVSDSGPHGPLVNICGCKYMFHTFALDALFNPFALRKAKIVYTFGLSECNKVKD